MSEEKKTLSIDPELCQGCQLCCNNCDEVFEFDFDENVATVKKKTGWEKCGCDIEEVIKDCPGDAISLK